MKPIAHIPELVTSGSGLYQKANYYCAKCDAYLDPRICKLSPLMVFEEAGAFMPGDETVPHILCDHVAAEKEREDGAKVKDIALAELPDDEKAKQTSGLPLTDMEKMVNRSGFANFFAMRDMTDPNRKS